MWRPVFDSLDIDNDGRIPLNEFAAMLKEGNLHLNEVPQEILEQILERVDFDRNRYLTYDEFLHMVRSPIPSLSCSCFALQVRTRELTHIHPRLHQLIRYAAVAVVPQKERRTIVSSYIDEYNCFHPPIFMLLVSVIEIAAFVYYCVDLEEFGTNGPVPYNSPLIYNPSRRYEGWRFLTYALIHAGFLHVFFNVLVQLCLGIPLEMVHKGWRVAIVYAAGIVSGSLAVSITDPKTYLAGASGGVYALIAAHLASVVLNFKEMEYGIIRLAGLLLFAALDIGNAVVSRYSMKQNRTSYAAHLSGTIAGFLVGILVLRNLRVRRWEVVVGWFAAVIYILLVGAAILVNVVHEDYFLPPDASSLSDSMRKDLPHFNH